MLFTQAQVIVQLEISEHINEKYLVTNESGGQRRILYPARW